MKNWVIREKINLFLIMILHFCWAVHSSKNAVFKVRNLIDKIYKENVGLIFLFVEGVKNCVFSSGRANLFKKDNLTVREILQRFSFKPSNPSFVTRPTLNEFLSVCIRYPKTGCVNLHTEENETRTVQFLSGIRRVI